MRLWITVLAAVALLSGCGLPGPMRHATPLGPWPETAPDGSPLTGTFEEGVSAGSEAAREPSTVGNYFGGVMTPFALPLCVIGATTFAVCMASGAPISSVTDEDEPPTPTRDRELPENAKSRTPAFLEGYDKGYSNTLAVRRRNAHAAGFWTTMGIVAIGAVYYSTLEPDGRRELLGREESATSGQRPRGATLLEF